MSFKKFVKQFLSNQDVEDPQNVLRVINTLQNNIEDSFSPLNSKIQNDSTILSNISLKANQVNIINHTLNRNLLGWIIIRQRALSSIFDTQDNNKSPNLTLQLMTSNDVVVDILVF